MLSVRDFGRTIPPGSNTAQHFRDAGYTVVHAVDLVGQTRTGVDAWNTCHKWCEAVFGETYNWSGTNFFFMPTDYEKIQMFRSRWVWYLDDLIEFGYPWAVFIGDDDLEEFVDQIMGLGAQPRVSPFDCSIHDVMGLNNEDQALLAKLMGYELVFDLSKVETGPTDDELWKSSPHPYE